MKKDKTRQSSLCVGSRRDASYPSWLRPIGMFFEGQAQERATWPKKGRKTEHAPARVPLCVRRRRRRSRASVGETAEPKKTHAVCRDSAHQCDLLVRQREGQHLRPKTVSTVQTSSDLSSAAPPPNPTIHARLNPQTLPKPSSEKP